MILWAIIHLLVQAEILMRHFHPVHHATYWINCEISEPRSYTSGCTLIKFWPHGLKITW